MVVGVGGGVVVVGGGFNDEEHRKIRFSSSAEETRDATYADL